jgi:hypothetical protein
MFLPPAARALKNRRLRTGAKNRSLKKPAGRLSTAAMTGHLAEPLPE